MERPHWPNRRRLAWWLVVGALFLAAAFTAYSLVGTFTFGLFLYYGTRPVYRRVRRFVPSSGIAASLTLLLTALPGLILVAYLALRGLNELVPYLDTLRRLLAPHVDLELLAREPAAVLLDFVRRPAESRFWRLFDTWTQYLGIVGQALQTLFIAVILAFYLLRDGDRIARWFEETVAERGSAAHTYVTAVDNDLETIYSSNVLLVLLVAVLATVIYNVYNLLAPAPVDIPFPTAMALLTGFATLIPILVGKVIYVPLVVYLGVGAAQTETALVFPVGLLLVSFLVLDFVPLTFLLPALAGRETHVGLVMFAYILGAVIFGWYGLFLGPLLVVLGVQAVRIVLPELLSGAPVSSDIRSAETLGSTPEEADDRTEGEEEDRDGG